MPIESITFEEAGHVIERNWREFHVPGVVKAFGVAERDGQIRFIIKVRAQRDVRSIRRRVGPRVVEGLPVFVEVLRMRGPGVPDAAQVEAARPRTGLLHFLMDRPGVLVAGVGAAVAAVWILSAGR